jgi:hypothetical protein
MSKTTSLSQQLGKSGRLYLRYLPDAAALKRLTGMQKELAVSQPGAKVVEKQKLHLTVLHLGHFGELYDELRSANRRLHEEAFAATLASFIRICQLRLPAETSVKPTAYARCGAKDAVLALGVAADRQLAAVCRTIIQDLNGLLTACGVADTEKFLRRSPNLGHAAEYQPHLSLLRGIKAGVDLKPPRDALKLTLHHLL